MTVTVGLFLGLFGFYLVKGSVARDYETGVGQILMKPALRRMEITPVNWLFHRYVVSARGWLRALSLSLLPL